MSALLLVSILWFTHRRKRFGGNGSVTRKGNVTTLLIEVDTEVNQ